MQHAVEYVGYICSSKFQFEFVILMRDRDRGSENIRGNAIEELLSIVGVIRGTLQWWDIARCKVNSKWSNHFPRYHRMCCGAWTGRLQLYSSCTEHDLHFGIVCAQWIFSQRVININNSHLMGRPTIALGLKSMLCWCDWLPFSSNTGNRPRTDYTEKFRT